VTAAVLVVAAHSAIASPPPTGYWISEYAASAKLEAKYDFAYCHGLRRHGTYALNTSQWGWVPGYWRFECSYQTQYKSCYGGQFESDSGKRRNQWFIRILSPGRCYAR
jgi:hypothetical protein